MNSVVGNPVYNIERLSEENLAGMEKLYTAVYNRISPQDFFRKKYNTAFTGVEYAGFIAYNNQKIPVAFYGVIPCFLQVDGKVVLAAQSADTMTHPDYRNKGLFVELALLTYQLCRETGIKVVFGFPNQNSLPGFINKLGWEKTEMMDCFMIQASLFSWDKIFNKLSILEKLYHSYQQAILKKYSAPQQGVTNSVIQEGFSGVYRDTDYLDYKIYTNTYVIKIGSSSVWLKISNVLLIGDIALGGNDFDRVMYGLKKLARRLGIKEIHFHSSPGTALHAFFAARFKTIPSFPVIFKEIEGTESLNKIKFTTADIDTF